jgi:hypothetical protein
VLKPGAVFVDLLARPSRQPTDSFFCLEKLVEFVRNLIRKQQHGAAWIDACVFGK